MKFVMDVVQQRTILENSKKRMSIMSLDTQEEIQQFLVLQKKSDSDLRALCEGMQLSPYGTREDLVNRLLTLNIEPQTDFLAPQMIALRTKIHGMEIPGAEEFMKRVRKVIFEGKGNIRSFSVLNGKFESYDRRMKYAKCSYETLTMLLEKDMVYPHPSQRELVKLVKKEPLIFSFYIVQRNYGKDKTFIMLHCSPKLETSNGYQESTGS